jgi:hypothetical protein
LSHPPSTPDVRLHLRVLKYVKRLLVINPDQQHGQADALPAVPVADYLDIEARLLRWISVLQWG